MEKKIGRTSVENILYVYIGTTSRAVQCGTCVITAVYT